MAANGAGSIFVYLRLGAGVLIFLLGGFGSRLASRVSREIRRIDGPFVVKELH
jgi:cytochrome c biogenesis protein CcdA